MKTFKQFLTEAKQLNEAFLTKEEDILNWLENHDTSYNRNKYTIKNGIVDVNDNIFITKIEQNELSIQFGTINGYFYCDDNKLTTLKGCPKKVKGNFKCSYNNLISLKYAPERVDGNFDCAWNNLKSLDGAPKYVGGIFDCSGNPKLKSLDGIGEVKEKIRSDIK